MEYNLRGIQPKIQVLQRIGEGEQNHPDIELLYLLEGTLEVSFGEQKADLKPEDFVLVRFDQRSGRAVRPAPKPVKKAAAPISGK